MNRKFKEGDVIISNRGTKPLEVCYVPDRSWDTWGLKYLHNGKINYVSNDCVSATNVSQVPASENMGVFASALGGAHVNARLAFYSIGESLDLALLDARVTTLINTFASTIP